MTTTETFLTMYLLPQGRAIIPTVTSTRKEREAVVSALRFQLGIECEWRQTANEEPMLALLETSDETPDTWRAICRIMQETLGGIVSMVSLLDVHQLAERMTNAQLGALTAGLSKLLAERLSAS